MLLVPTESLAFEDEEQMNHMLGARAFELWSNVLPKHIGLLTDVPLDAPAQQDEHGVWQRGELPDEDADMDDEVEVYMYVSCHVRCHDASVYNTPEDHTVAYNASMQDKREWRKIWPDVTMLLADAFRTLRDHKLIQPESLLDHYKHLLAYDTKPKHTQINPATLHREPPWRELVNFQSYSVFKRRKPSQPRPKGPNHRDVVAGLATPDVKRGRARGAAASGTKRTTARDDEDDEGEENDADEDDGAVDGGSDHTEDATAPNVARPDAALQLLEVVKVPDRTRVVAVVHPTRHEVHILEAAAP
jgi:hypothetical protein